MRRSLRSWTLFALLAAALPLAALAQDAARPAADRELQSELEDSYKVLPLSSGYVLQPTDDSADYRALEMLADGSVRIDGKAPDEAQSLRDIVGTDAYRVIVKLRKLDEAQRNELFAATSEGRELPEAEGADVPVPPEAPEAAPGVPAVSPAPPVPPTPPEPRIHSDAKVSVGSGVTVDEDEVVTEDVVAVGGPLEINGEVRGDAVAVGGGAEINGRVTGEVIVIGSSVTLGPKADIGRDVTSVGGKVERDPAAKVGGKVSEVAFGSSTGLGILRGLRHMRQHDRDRDEDWTDNWEFKPFSHAAGIFWNFFGFVVAALFACLIVLVARAPMERIERKVDEEPWKAGLVGLVSQIAFLPLLVVTCIVLAVSIIGIPLLLLVPFVIIGLVLMGFLGYVAVAHRVGQWAEQRFNWRGNNVYWVVVMGMGLLAAFGFVSRALDFRPLGALSVLLAIAGFMVQYAALTVGFGGALLTRFGAGGRSAPAPPPAPEPIAAEPVPPPPGSPLASSTPAVNPYEGSPWEDTPPAAPPSDETPR
jgi:hypothetical protein